jgi:hypothetical protein
MAQGNKESGKKDDEFLPIFKRIYQLLISEVDLLGMGRSQIPWNKAVERKELIEALKEAIALGAPDFPLRFQDAYINPLINNLDRLVEHEDIDYLVGAVYDLGADERVRKSTQCLLAVMSNFNRSFLSKRRRILAQVPLRTVLPPLATFRYEASIDNPAPFILPIDQVYGLFKGKVGVVCLPSTYIDHTLLWSVLAHEAGGHDVLSADATLLPELEGDVRSLMGGGPIYPGKKWSRAQFLGFLWQYWLEESAADVYAVLNMGPAYALAVAAYTAALNHHIYKAVQLELEQQLEQASGRPEEPRIREALTIILDRVERGEKGPILNVGPSGRPGMHDLDTHPTDILRLHLLKGAIESLVGLQEDRQKYYLGLLQRIIDEFDPKGEEIVISGYFQAGMDTWIEVKENEIFGVPRYSLPLEFMTEKARTVGSYIATARLKALDGHTIQELETWDDMDEHAAMQIKSKLEDKRPLETGKPALDTEGSIDNYGDDAQLLAGAMMAFLNDPVSYFRINDRLKEALLRSYERDKYWGRTVLHPMDEVE